MTIAAIATARGLSAVAAVRVSGADAAEIADKIFKSDKGVRVRDFVSHTMYLGRADCGGFSDRVYCCYFKAPRSFTGEDSVEFFCHGGGAAASGILESLIKSGARHARPGEFTKRAFLNGKMSLADAEGIIDLIHAESKAAAAAAEFLSNGGLTREVKKLQERLTDISAEVEMNIDYPEEKFDKGRLAGAADTLLADAVRLTESYAHGKIIKNGLNVVIAGLPNAGKSSLLNALLKFDRAIVSEEAGTTRDTVSESVTYGDVKINLTDTAGIAEAAGEVERMGVARSKKAVTQADVVLYVFDGARGLTEDDNKLIAELTARGAEYILIQNKSDLKIKPVKGALPVSAVKNTGIAELTDRLCAFTRTVSPADITLTNERHYDALRAASAALADAARHLKDSELVLTAEELRAANKSIGEITGDTVSEEIIDRIFERFCLGK